MAIDYRDEAIQGAFPNIRDAGLTVRSQVQSDAWVVNAKDLEQALGEPKDTAKYWVLGELTILVAFYLLLHFK